MSLTIESATVEGIAECLALIKASVAELAVTHYSDDEIAAWISHYPEHDEFAAWGRNRTTFMAREGKRLVGFGQIDVSRNEIEGIHVAPDRARNRIGAQLVEKMEKAAIDAGLGELQVQASLNAADFYTACGYEVVREITFRCRNRVSLNAFLMKKSLARVIE